MSSILSSAMQQVYPSQTLIVVSSCITATKQATGTCELLLVLDALSPTRATVALLKMPVLGTL
jgi:hypothetical protein